MPVKEGLQCRRRGLKRPSGIDGNHPERQYAQTHYFEASYPRGVTVRLTWSVDIEVTRCLKQQGSCNSDDSTSSAGDELGCSICELSRRRRRGGAGRDWDCCGRCRSAAGSGWGATVVATATSGESVARRGTSAQDDARGRVFAVSRVIIFLAG